MALFAGSMVGLMFGVASAFAGRRWGTVLACIPIATWFIIYAVVSLDGLHDDQVAPLCYALLGVLLGVLTGQVLSRWRRRAGSADSR